MPRRIRQIGFVSAFVLIVALWCASYWNISYAPPSQELIYLSRGVIDWMHPAPGQREMWKIIAAFIPDSDWKLGEFDGFSTTWIPDAFYQKYPTGMTRVKIPLWMPTLLMGVVSFWDNIKRFLRGRRAGFCRNCGYDLTGNKSGKCPECGTSIGGQIEGDNGVSEEGVKV